MGVYRGVRYGNVLVRPDGTVPIPGGIVARLGSGAAGQTLTFPIIGFFDDGQLSAIIFIDTGTTPLYEEKVDYGTGRGFPPIVLTGLVPGTFVAYQVAQTESAARFMNSGGQLATDSSGRVVVVTPTGGALSTIINPPAVSQQGVLTNVGDVITLALDGGQWATAKLTVNAAAAASDIFEYSDDGGVNFSGAGGTKPCPYGRRISAVSNNPTVQSLGAFGAAVTLTTGDVWEIPLPANCTHVRIRRSVTSAVAETFTLSNGQIYVPGKVVDAVMYDVTSGLAAALSPQFDFSGWTWAFHYFSMSGGVPAFVIQPVDDAGAGLDALVTGNAKFAGGLGPGTTIGGVASSMAPTAQAPLPKRVLYSAGVIAAQTNRIRIEARR